MPASAWGIQAGTATLHNVQANVTVNFEPGIFDTAPVVVGIMTFNGGDAGAARIFDITTSSFTVALVEPSNMPVFHAAETFYWVAVEPGVHMLPGGVQVEAGTISTDKVITSGLTDPDPPTGWETVSFASSFSSPPAVFADLQTRANQPSLTANTNPALFMTVASVAGASSVNLAIERSETNIAGTSEDVAVAETIGYIAFGQTGFTNLRDKDNVLRSMQVLVPGNAWVQGAGTCRYQTVASMIGQSSAVVIGKKTTRIDDDGGWLRSCSYTPTNGRFGFRVDEDTVKDTERTHTTFEGAAIIAFSAPFAARLETDLTVSVDEPLILSNSYQSGEPNPLALPTAVIEYGVTVSNEGQIPTDHNSLVVDISVPAEAQMLLGNIGGAGSGPISFDDPSGLSELTYTFTSLTSTADDLEFSNDGGASYAYAPVQDSESLDPNITNVRIRPKGAFAGKGTNGEIRSVKIGTRFKVN